MTTRAQDLLVGRSTVHVYNGRIVKPWNLHSRRRCADQWLRQSINHRHLIIGIHTDSTAHEQRLPWEPQRSFCMPGSRQVSEQATVSKIFH